MIKMGMMIGDRYEILEKIGTGGMSDVYKAKCHKLNRFVAVKVLKQEFSENASFVSKFRIEAQAAAGLMHPNIVNVYDVGEEGGIYYIVMELVEGITLKKYIEKKARLSYKEAVSIAIQVSMGIEAAHNNHIIHRDIKPQNIIISRDGKVKVTDFGIAKAASSNTITSNVMGSVHYTSPEQARGGYSDEKSDIYSLGISLFEMLTGRVPFNGETTVAIAIKHIQEDMPSPKEYVPEIPASVEGIVLKCCQKSPDRRYQNMQELVADLKQALIKPEEVIAVNGASDMEATHMLTDDDIVQIKQRAAYKENRDYAEDPSDYPPEEPEYDYDEMEEETHSSRGEKLTTIITVLAGVVICILILILAVKFLSGLGTGDNIRPDNPIISDDQADDGPILPDEDETESQFVKMPAVVGKTVESARDELEALDMEVVLESEESDTVDAGKVIRASINEGVQLVRGSRVTLVVSAGIQGVEVPGVEGYTFEDAESRLKDVGLTAHRQDVYSDSVEPGWVISQMPSAGNSVSPGSAITITVSVGKEKVRVPNIIGRPLEDGIIELVEAGLSQGIVTNVYSDIVEEGLICTQSYSEGSYVAPGTSVNIEVSQGKRQVTYKCNVSIAAPTVSEAPDYVTGSEVALKLVADDGEVLLETKTVSFPYAANYRGLKSAAGTLTVTYTVTTEGTTTTDPETGETVNVPGTKENKSFTRRVEFVQE